MSLSLRPHFKTLSLSEYLKKRAIGKSKANLEFLALSPCYEINHKPTNSDLDLGVSFKMLFGSASIVILQNTNKVY